MQESSPVSDGFPEITTFVADLLDYEKVFRLGQEKWRLNRLKPEMIYRVDET